jgi:hypothetical protein
VIDTRNHTLTHVIPLNGHMPVPLAVAPDGAAVYVGLRRGGLAIIDTATKRVTTIETGDAPVDDIAITPDGRNIYLAMEHSGLGLFDRESRLIRNVSQAQCPKNLALSPDGRVLWVAYQCGGPGGSPGREAIGRFDAATGEFLGAITGFPQVGGPITVSADGSRVWANAADACLAERYAKAGCSQTPARLINIIDTANNQRVEGLTFGGFEPRHMTAYPAGSAVAVGGPEGLLFFDARTRLRLGMFPIPANSITFTRDGGRGYASVPDWQQIIALDFVLSVAVDISPDPGGKTLSLGLGSPLTVTIHRSAVDATTIDPKTVTLNGVAAERKSDGKAWASVSWRQGENRLVMRFDRSALDHKIGESELVLEGMTAAGTRVRGSTRVHVTP